MSCNNFSDAIIVVGTGLSGVSCALTILENGRRVILLEKEKKCGGNSIRAISINASQSHHQKEQNISDSNESFMNDTAYSSTKNINAKPNELIKTLAQNSAESLKWIESHGFKMPVLVHDCGHSEARTHLPISGRAGGYITLGLLRYIKKYAKQGYCRIIKEAKMTSLIKENGRVIGLCYEDRKIGINKEIKGGAVVIATGGFCYNVSMLKEFSRKNAHLSTTNGHWANGEGILAARDIGAKLVDMEYIQVHPLGFIDPINPNKRETILAAECLRAAILINEKGYRFVNESGHRDDVTFAEQKEKGPFRIILNNNASNIIKPYIRMYTDYFKMLKVYKNSYELAKDMNIDVNNLIDTYNSYNVSWKKGLCQITGKKRFPGAPYSADQELRVGLVGPVLHYTMGGIAIDTKAHCLDINNNIIVGLFACGETTGGIHGKNRLASNALTDCVVFGRIAAYSSIKMLNNRKSKL